MHTILTFVVFALAFVGFISIAAIAIGCVVINDRVLNKDQSGTVEKKQFIIETGEDGYQEHRIVFLKTDKGVSKPYEVSKNIYKSFSLGENIDHMGAEIRKREDESKLK